MDQHGPKTEDRAAETGRDETQAKQERPPKRFRVVKVEERIAPAAGGTNILWTAYCSYRALVVC
jgi:hypothetical protein